MCVTACVLRTKVFRRCPSGDGDGNLVKGRGPRDQYNTFRVKVKVLKLHVESFHPFISILIKIKSLSSLDLYDSLET